MLNVETVDLHYGAAQALRKVSLSATAGRVTAVLGRNGVGKTSLMRAIAGLPLGALLWTFGTPSHADGDGWVGEQGRIALAKGGLVVTPDANGRAILLSPADLPASLQRATQFVIGVDSHAGLRRVRPNPPT